MQRTRMSTIGHVTVSRRVSQEEIEHHRESSNYGFSDSDSINESKKNRIRQSVNSNSSSNNKMTWKLMIHHRCHHHMLPPMPPPPSLAELMQKIVDTHGDIDLDDLDITNHPQVRMMQDSFNASMDEYIETLVYCPTCKE